MKVADYSFAYFVYPFVFDSHHAQEHIEAFKAAQYENKRVWTPQPFPTDDLMPHVASFIDSQDTCAAETDVPTAFFWKLNDDLHDVYGLAHSADWTLCAKNTLAIPFQFGEVGADRFAVHLALFCSGVGFLTFQAQPKSAELDAWLDFLHYFRIGDGQRNVHVEAQKRAGQDTGAAFFPEPASGVSQRLGGRHTLQELWQTLLRTGSVKGGEADWWKDVFVSGRTLPYVCLYVEEMREEPDCARLLYRLRNFFRSGQEIAPGASDLRLDHPSLVEFAERQWFVFSLEGSAFLACAAPDIDFFRETLPRHVRREYFLIFLLALQQRFTLIRLSDEVARKWQWNDVKRWDEDKRRNEDNEQDTREKDFGILRDNLLQFTARGYFAQVMQREHHHRCYVKWLDMFQIERLYSEVRDEVQGMHDYILLQQNRRQAEQSEQAAHATTLLTKVAGVLGPPGLVFAACQAAAMNDPYIVATLAAIAFLLSGGVVYLLDRNARTQKQSRDKAGASLTHSPRKPLKPHSQNALPPPKSH